VIAGALVVSACLAAAPPALAPDRLQEPGGQRLELAQGWEAPPSEEEREESPRRIRLTAWGGEALASGGSGHGSALYGGEAAWAFDSIDLGVAGYGYRSIEDATRAWTPVVLLRLTERFLTRKGVEAAFTFGVGAGRPRDWTAWFQVALGVRLNLGPMFLAGELAFEQTDLLRLAAGVGATF
jgi:hypothetical protein